MRKIFFWDALDALNMGIACAVTYFLATQVLSSLVVESNSLLGGMWATASTIYVFRETRDTSVSALVSRLIATFVSFLLCFLYIAAKQPVNALGIGFLVGLCTIIMMLVNRRDAVVTAGITTVVVVVAAKLDPEHALLQAPLRLLDTVVGVLIGAAFKLTALRAAERFGILPSGKDKSPTLRQ